MIFTLACAVADSFASLLVFRLFNGMVASAPIATVGGLFADVHDDPTLRGRLMAYYMAVSQDPFLLPWCLGIRSNTMTVHHVRTHHRSMGFWLCCSRQLALVFLDRSNSGGCQFAIDHLYAGDICTRYLEASRPEAPQRYWEL